MDEIEKILRAGQGSTLTKTMVEKLLKMIDEYGEDQWSRGHGVGKEDGYDSAVFNECS